MRAVLARAWRAVTRAFAPAPDARASQQYGADTTLFGGGDPPRDGTQKDAVKNEFWMPTETTDFADMDTEREARRRK